MSAVHSADDVLAWYECGRKVPHRTHSGAEIAALDAWHRGVRDDPNPPGVYECERCGYYHVGRHSQDRSGSVRRSLKQARFLRGETP